MIIDQIIKNRKTEKVLANSPWRVSKSKEALDKTIDQLLELAEYAPYHKKCHEYYTGADRELNSCVPWRFYILDTEACRKLYNYIEIENIKAGKISNMLAAADVMFLVTWLPDPYEQNLSEIYSDNTEEPFPFSGNIRNMEHIAAGSSAIQNVLIGATARNIPNYWSSGGLIRNIELRNYLEVPIDEILLGAIFLFPEDYSERDSFVKPGKMRNQGKERSTWSKRLILNKTTITHSEQN